ncbi:hypothetical protein [Alicyclobacillus fastidiosus]|uniref:hypothetical protein n=1 Tax=Alicyclobacillus fastidiosus TaxID=392011 RepID=UPI0034D69761
MVYTYGNIAWVGARYDWYGPTDFRQMSLYPSIIDLDASDSPESLFIGYPIQEHSDLVKQANPITYITENTPPFLIMHETRTSTCHTTKASWFLKHEIRKDLNR